MLRLDPLSYIGRSNARLPYKTFGITQADRLLHLYAIGRTGTGKTTLLETLALQDILSGRGCAVIDPHGDLVDRLVRSVPAHRYPDLIHIDTPRESQPFGYNPLRRVRKDRIGLAVSGLIDAFRKFWTDAWGTRMEHVLRNALFALLEWGEGSLPDILTMLSDREFRREVLRHVTNPQVLQFWEEEFPKYNPRYQQEMIAPIQNKVGALLADPRLRRILSAPDIDVSFRRAMDEGKIVLVNLSKGELGEDSSGLLGALLVSTLALAAFSRADIPASSRRPFFVYIDEFQSFTTQAVANMVSELRKYAVGLTLANQHLGQLDVDIRQSVLGNVGTVLAFRLGADDAQAFAREFAPVFGPEDLVGLGNHEVIIRLMIDGKPSRPFSGTTLHPDAVRGLRRQQGRSQTNKNQGVS